MLYKEYQPSLVLLPYIETYWTAEGYSNQKQLEKILPDGCVDIIFSFGDSSLDDQLTPYWSDDNLFRSLLLQRCIYAGDSV